jgi:hypothetical protein
MTMIRSLIFALTMAMTRADFSGVWKMVEATTPLLLPVELPSESSDGVTMTLEKEGPEEYKVMFKSGNLINGDLTIEEEMSGTFAMVKFSSLSSTRMLAPPEYRAAEEFIQNNIPDVATMEIDSNGALILEGGSDAGLSVKFELVASS